MSALTIRPATREDLSRVQQTLYLALAWDPNDPIPPIETVLAHPEVSRYHEGWGRSGDAGVIAEDDGIFAGMAYYRFFTDEDHGAGYMDEETPELAIAIAETYRGQGIGTRLMAELANMARSSGIPRISLSVSKGNPAARLYQRVGYVPVIGADEELMVLDLG